MITFLAEKRNVVKACKELIETICTYLQSGNNILTLQSLFNQLKLNKYTNHFF